MDYPDTQLFINGKWQDAAEGRTLPVVDPSTGREIGIVACAGIADLDRALAAAQTGFEVWRDTPAFERSKVMRSAAGLLRERQEAIASVITQEQGKPLAEAKVEVTLAAGIIEWFAEEGFRAYGRVVPSRDIRAQQLVVKDPVGPVAAFTPWNFPVNQVVRKLSAALTTGCSIIIKAPEETPAGPAALIQAFVDAGIPDGVIGLVFGIPAEISSYLIPHPVIKKVSFTGATSVGKQLAALAGKHMKRTTMELGGHAPFIIAEDANVELAVRIAGNSKFRNCGQVCISPTRFLVHESVSQEFTAGLVKHARELKVGNGAVEGVQMGPLANVRRLEAMTELTRDAVRHGATVAAGGVRIGEQGNFWAPTVLTDVPLQSKVFNEEPFGPMAVVHRYKTMEEAIKEANRLEYGLAGYAFTRSLRNAHLLSMRLEVGMLWVNQTSAPWPELPFGGVKDSGYGTEGGPEALDAYLNTRTVSIMNV
ncbi:NAD-dependent succinate-semialdehyde dehydrogenase [Paraburkholderia sp. GAS334]|jgi:succinate-semialdehyde dehydrogenase/glutarate-semialdehyde dehydrogenase|uniref:NAD-dependent succinate-semialdehyde dehydrogenase n=1 Tax=Paraburkholderia sp. GAS334 TaxID=3035131 RepID=UPI003D261346